MSLLIKKSISSCIKFPRVRPKQQLRTYATAPPPKMIEIEIDGKKTKVLPGITILQACATVGIEIPRFCYHEVR